MGKETRTPTDKQLGMDLSKPLKDLDQMEMEMDCFGRLYEHTNPACQYCGANVVCSVVFHKRHSKARVDELRKKRGGAFLDEVNYDRVPWSRIAENVRKGKQYEVEELMEVVSQLSKCGDYGLNSARVMRFLAEEKLTVKRGKLEQR